MLFCAALAATLQMSRQELRHAPAWLDLKLAGYVLGNDERNPEILVRDKRSGYFMMRTGECDGAILILELTRDHRDPQNHFDGGVLQSPKAKHLQLTTGKGVKIGCSTTELIHILGRATKVERSGECREYTDYVYEWRTGEKRGDPVEYLETYTF